MTAEKIKNGIKKIKDHRLSKEVKERTAGYIIAAMGLVAGLAWNEAIKSLIDTVFPISKNGILLKFVYAAVITVFIVVISVYLTKPTEGEKTP